MLGALQLIGALLVLLPFVGTQSGIADSGSPLVLGLNLAGSSLLAAVAVTGSNWGFLILEGAWACVSAGALARLAVTPSAPRRRDG